MGNWIALLLPFFLVMARVTAFFAVLPMFAWSMLPKRVRLAIAITCTIFFAMILPGPKLAAVDTHWMGGMILVGREVLTGLALGLAARLVFIAVQQGVLMGTQQMGFADAGIIDPSTGESIRPVAMLFQMVFTVLFLSVGGHHLLILAIRRSYEVFPIGSPPEIATVVQGLVDASVVMFVFALKLAAPLMAGFMLLAVVMGVIARVMPEMNVLLASLPLRVAMGLFLSMAVLGTLNAMVKEVADWLDSFLILT
ncbi:MAG: flagellar biosynthetic protein FliR [Phycisphaerae bacterium]|nr:flagellar biosynthetic protein FliR [Phycisphaerae bacterium]